MFKAIGKWLVDASELTALIERGNGVVYKLTQTNPKHMHPKLYRGMLDLVKQINDEARFLEEPALNEFEVAYLEMAFIQNVLEHMGDQGPFKVDLYADALRKLSKEHGDHIRGQVKIARGMM